MTADFFWFLLGFLLHILVIVKGHVHLPVMVEGHVCFLKKKPDPSLGDTLRWSLSYDEICSCQRILAPGVMMNTCPDEYDQTCSDASSCNLWFVNNHAPLTRRQNWRKETLDLLLERADHCYPKLSLESDHEQSTANIDPISTVKGDVTSKTSTPTADDDSSVADVNNSPNHVTTETSQDTKSATKDLSTDPITTTARGGITTDKETTVSLATSDQTSAALSTLGATTTDKVTTAASITSQTHTTKDPKSSVEPDQDETTAKSNPLSSVKDDVTSTADDDSSKSDVTNSPKHVTTGTSHETNSPSKDLSTDPITTTAGGGITTDKETTVFLATSDQTSAALSTLGATTKDRITTAAYITSHSTKDPESSVEPDQADTTAKSNPLSSVKDDVTSKADDDSSKSDVTNSPKHVTTDTSQETNSPSKDLSTDPITTTAGGGITTDKETTVFLATSDQTSAALSTLGATTKDRITTAVSTTSCSQSRAKPCTVGKLGLQDKTIPDSAITVSSDSNSPRYGRLNGVNWNPTHSDPAKWFHLDLGCPTTTVTGLITQGSSQSSLPIYVTSLKVSTSADNESNLIFIQNEAFEANIDESSKTTIMFPDQVNVRLVRVTVIRCNHSFLCSLKLEILGCTD